MLFSSPFQKASVIGVLSVLAASGCWAASSSFEYHNRLPGLVVTQNAAPTVPAPIAPAVFNISPAVAGLSSWTPSTQGALSISVPGTYTLTASVAVKVSLKAWGAGGGSSNAFYGKWPTGGGGGFAGGSFTFAANQSYTLVVGSGGAQGTTSGPAVGGIGFGGSGGFGGGYAHGGAGGGLTGLFFGTSVTQANAMLIAGGGGGSGGDNVLPQSGTAGGGSAVAAGPGPTPVVPPTATAPGANASGMLGASGGVSPYGYGYGGGGGGYWGGGASVMRFVNDAYGGTGGLGYYLPSAISNPVLTTGIGSTPGNSGESERPAGAGVGGRYAPGGPGAVVLH